MKKIYLAGLAVILLFLLIYFLLPVRQDMNKKVANTTTVADPSSASPIGNKAGRRQQPNYYC